MLIAISAEKNDSNNNTRKTKTKCRLSFFSGVKKSIKIKTSKTRFCVLFHVYEERTQKNNNTRNNSSISDTTTI